MDLTLPARELDPAPGKQTRESKSIPARTCYTKREMSLCAWRVHYWILQEGYCRSNFGSQYRSRCGGDALEARNRRRALSISRRKRPGTDCFIPLYQVEFCGTYIHSRFSRHVGLFCHLNLRIPSPWLMEAISWIGANSAPGQCCTK